VNFEKLNSEIGETDKTSSLNKARDLNKT